MERKIGPTVEYFTLREMLEGTNDLQATAHRSVQDVFEFAKKHRPAIGKWIAVQRAQGERFDLAESAPDRRLGREQDVSAG